MLLSMILGLIALALVVVVVDPRLRLPMPGEVLQAFTHSRTVPSAVLALDNAIARLETAAEHQAAEATRAFNRAANLRKEAGAYDLQAKTSQLEADRAVRVQAKLKELTS